MGHQYLIDTNVAVGYLENQLPLQWINDLSKVTIQLSVIVRIELLAWPDATPHKLQILHAFVSSSMVHDLDEPVILENINIRKLYKIKLPDAIIAATAIVNNLTLLSRNLSDFKKIPNLLLLDPYRV